MFFATNNDFDIQPTKHVENKRSYNHYYLILYTLLDNWTIDHIGPRVIPSFVGQDRMGNGHQAPNGRGDLATEKNNLHVINMYKIVQVVICMVKLWAQYICEYTYWLDIQAILYTYRETSCDPPRSRRFSPGICDWYPLENHEIMAHGNSAQPLMNQTFYKHQGLIDVCKATSIGSTISNFTINCWYKAIKICSLLLGP